MLDLDRRRVGGRRHQVVHERRRQELPVLVVRGVLEQRLAEPLDDAAADLPLDDGRVDHPAAVLDDDVARNAHGTGLAVDLDDADVRRARPPAAGLREHRRGFDGSASQLRDRFIDARGAGFLQQLLAQLRDGRDRGARGHRRGAAPAGAIREERRRARIAVHDRDALQRHAERVGRDLSQRRLVALAVR